MSLLQSNNLPDTESVIEGVKEKGSARKRYSSFFIFPVGFTLKVIVSSLIIL
nr:MAG TPA: hypothetical protein [Caudoviricetes sp.]DAZ37980.1 MAG TPA: hypothetical protein [Caudoviricetes sp.]